MGLRLACAVVVNLAIGIVLALWLIRHALRWGVGTAADYGFSGAGPTVLGIAWIARAPGRTPPS